MESYEHYYSRCSGLGNEPTYEDYKEDVGCNSPGLGDTMGFNLI